MAPMARTNQLGGCCGSHTRGQCGQDGGHRGTERFRDTDIQKKESRGWVESSFTELENSREVGLQEKRVPFSTPTAGAPEWLS